MQAYHSSTLNPPLPTLFRFIASVEWLVLAAAGFGLFFLPIIASAQWPWPITPFNAAHRVNWTQPGTWLWISLFAVLLLTGIGLIVLALGKHPVQQQKQERRAEGSALNKLVE